MKDDGYGQWVDELELVEKLDADVADLPELVDTTDDCVDVAEPSESSVPGG